MHRALHLSLAAAAALLVTAAPAMADIPGPHPGEIHAMSDLRMARAYLEDPGRANTVRQEEFAVGDVDRAIGDVRQAAFDDGKNVRERLPIDTSLVGRDRLRRAGELLRSARRDLTGPESNGWAQGPLAAAQRDIDRAIRHTDDAMHDRFWDHFAG